MRRHSPVKTYLIAAALTILAVLTIGSLAQKAKKTPETSSGAYLQSSQASKQQAGSTLNPPCEDAFYKDKAAILHNPSAEARRATRIKLPGGKEVNLYETMSPLYYLTLYGISSVRVSDTHGQTDDPLTYRAPSQHKLKRLSYEYPGQDSIMIMAPPSETYTVAFQPAGGTTDINLVKGVGNDWPDMAVRYNWLKLQPGTTATLKLTPEGVETLRVDTDGDDVFETTIEPTASVSGDDAKDIHAPTICFGETQQGTETIITISAADVSGVKSILYMLEDASGRESGFSPYTGPIRVNPQQTPFVYAVANDNVGNRTSVDDYKIRGRE